jgi:hypothetical protein
MEVRPMIAALLAAGALFLASPAADASPSPSPGASAVPQQHHAGSAHIFGGSLVIPADEIRDGDVTIFGGSVVIDGTVTHDVTVFGGSVNINGTVGHDVNVTGGSVHLGPNASVGHDVSTFGGSVERDPGARIGHDVTISDNGGDGSRFLPDLGTALGLPGLPNFGGLGQLFGVWLSLGLVLIALVVQLFFPAQVAVAAAGLVERPLSSLGFGALTALAGLLIALLLAVTIILIPVSLALIVAMGAAWVFGWAAIMLAIGQRLVVALGWQTTPLVTLLVGGVLTAVIVSLPVVGGLIWLLGGMFALGAVTLTRFGTRPVWPHLPAPTPPPLS